MVGAGPLRMLPLPVTARMKCVSSVSLVCSASLMELTSLERPPELLRRALDGVQLPMRISSARLGAGDADGRVELTLGFLWRNREKDQCGRWIVPFLRPRIWRGLVSLAIAIANRI